jgi:hypothetical protein
MSRLLHEIENNPDTESFLKENGKKFSQDCVTAMKLMYQGVRLNGETCKELYGLHDRRLRDCRQGRPDVVKSAWKRDAAGKRLYVEFWIDVPLPPTKQKAIESATKFLNNQQSLF